MTSSHSTDRECLVAAGLECPILEPSDADYATREDSYWSRSAKLHPVCIVQPQSAGDVAVAVKSLGAAGRSFAVRSGGSSFWAGSNNIANGTTIDLGQMSATVFHPETETVDIGPGARWGEVYAELFKHGRAVAGSREASVGVGGLLLGGGNTLFTARHGFACDQVLAYEIVLADGRILTVEANGEHTDLFYVLKGGGNNFGIVTRFTMRAIVCDSIWGGGAVMPRTVFDTAADAFVEFTATVENDTDSNLICMLGHLSPNPAVMVATLYANMAGVEKPAIFDKFLAMPQIMSTYKQTDLPELMATTAQPTGYHAIWFTLCFKNDASIMTKAAELHDDLVAEMVAHIPDGDFKSKCIFQPLPRAFAQRSLESGGNVMGVERHDQDGILWQVDVMVRTAELETWAYPRVRAFYESVRQFANSLEGGLLDWINLNYAHPTQEVLQSYGSENMQKMKEAANKYDPEGVFQRFCPGGFKISDI